MRELIEAAKAVLFDFDGPVCHLFQYHSPSDVAERLRRIAGGDGGGGGDIAGAGGVAGGVAGEVASGGDGCRRGGSGGDGGRLPGTGDPLEVLRAAYGRPGLVENGVARKLERALTEAEVEAAPHAFPTAFADALVRTLAATGRQLAITTNNSQQAVERYLETRQTYELFAGRIHGRNAEGSLRLKPDPDCLQRALQSTSTSAQDALMIGDAPRDLEAARAAGVAFLGYAHNERKAERLREAGAAHITASLRDVLLIVDPHAHV